MTSMTQPIHPMLERVARAMGHVIYERDGPEEAKRIVDGCWQDWLPEARAAVQALMEPTHDMCDDATGVLIDDGFGHGMTCLEWSEAREVYQAMLRPLVEGEAS